MTAPRQRSTIVRISEVGAAGGILSAETYLNGEKYTCAECGFSPLTPAKSGYPEGHVEAALLEPGPPVPNDPLLRSTYRCRDRAACATRAARRNDDDDAPSAHTRAGSARPQDD